MNIINLSIPAFRCPSTDLPMFGSGNNAVCMASYAGIMGAVEDTGNYTVTAQRGCCSCCPTDVGTGDSLNGLVSANGMLTYTKVYRMADCRDGTSNTMIIGEASDWAKDVNGITRHVDPSWPHGWPMGTAWGGTIGDGISAGNSNRPFNLTSVRYPIGTQWRRGYLLSGARRAGNA